MNHRDYSENMQRNHSRRLQKAPELKVTWYLRKKHLEGARTHLAEVGLEAGPPQTDRPGGGAGRSPPGPEPPHLLECSTTAS
jgi:hypothetical protein